MEPWNEDGDFAPPLKAWTDRMDPEAMKMTELASYYIPPPKPAKRHWKLREALRGLRMGWRGELG